MTDADTPQLPPDPADAQHVPVLLAAVIAGLAIAPGAWTIDATVGGGSHAQPSWSVLARMAEYSGLMQTRRRFGGCTNDWRMQSVQNAWC